jgi:hypothetical protein
MHTRKHHASALPWTGLVLFTLLLSAVVHTQITPLGNSYTNSASPTTNYGGKTLLDVDGTTQITYIQFNLASIPSGASVSQATLKLYVNSVPTAGRFNVDYVNGSWTEGTITWNSSPAFFESLRREALIRSDSNPSPQLTLLRHITEISF